MINIKNIVTHENQEVDREKVNHKTFPNEGKVDKFEIKDNRSTSTATSGDLTLLDLQNEIEKLTLVDRDTVMHRDPTTTYPIELLPMQQWKQVSKRAKKIIKDSSSNVSLASINTVSSNNSYPDLDTLDFSMMDTDEKMIRKKEMARRPKMWI